MILSKGPDLGGGGLAGNPFCYGFIHRSILAEPLLVAGPNRFWIAGIELMKE
jgi:hypothetical protein